MVAPRRAYLPAAGHDWALPFYDPVVKLLGGDRALRVLVDQADLRPGHRVLDVGCGTGTLVVMLKTRHPDVDVVGLDPDPKALFRARRKAYGAKIGLQLDRGFSDELPYPDGSFDRVFSSFMLHHLEPEEKEKTVREVRRVLKPGGLFLLLDFGGSGPSSEGLFARWFHANHRLQDNFGGRILALLSQAGFADAREVARGRLFFARIAYYRVSSELASS
jgi:ubiquinone/menaquinone biosynthesis C-methylase UbiE